MSDAEFLRTVLKSQYHAALAMLRQALDRCPQDRSNESRKRFPLV
jgi:hypothetical protein